MLRESCIELVDTGFHDDLSDVFLPQSFPDTFTGAKHAFNVSITQINIINISIGKR